MQRKSSYKSVFDIIGPVMVGPSSSHTAGAARIGKVVRHIFGEQPKQVDIYLYESFAKTYRGHGTDIALVGGLLGMEPDDSRLAEALVFAKEQGVEVRFIPTDAKADHPNSVQMVLASGERKLTVTGISIGGGKIRISEVNGFKIHLEEGVPTFLIIHQDVPGIIAQVTSIINELSINIGTMTVTREAKGEHAIMVIEVDQRQVGDALARINKIASVYEVSFFK